MFSEYRPTNHSEASQKKPTIVNIDALSPRLDLRLQIKVSLGSGPDSFVKVITPPRKDFFKIGERSIHNGLEKLGFMIRQQTGGEFYIDPRKGAIIGSSMCAVDPRSRPLPQNHMNEPLAVIIHTNHQANQQSRIEAAKHGFGVNWDHEFARYNAPHMIPVGRPGISIENLPDFQKHLNQGCGLTIFK